MILNTNRSWSVDFSNSVDWVKKFKMSFVARFNVDNDVIMMNEAEFNNDDYVISVNRIILMFWCNELT